MPVSVTNSKLIYDALKACDVKIMSALPETWLVHLIRMADEDPNTTLIRIAKEEEAVGISAGAHLAGVNSALLMQNHGLLAAINPIVPLALLYKIPLLMLTINRVEQWEATYGRIPKGAWVLIHTGWSQRKEREVFLNVKEDGAHSPGFHPTCSAFLARERDILGVGVETVGTDAGLAGGFDPPFPNHSYMHGAGRFGITSLINLDQLPPTGAIVIAAPLKIVNGSGSPLRVIAITR